MLFKLFKLASVVLLFQLTLFGCGAPDLEDFQGGAHLVLALELKEDGSIDRENMAKIIDIIENRLTKFDIRDRIIKSQEDKYIIIQLPPHENMKRAVAAISKPFVLEFKLIDETHDLDAATSGAVPAGLELLHGLKKNPTTKNLENTPFLVEKKALMKSPVLNDAKPVIRYEQPTVYIEMNEKDSVVFENLTGANLNRRLAVIVDNVVISDPMITEKIAGGKIGVAGYLTKDASHDIALGLNTGPYPAGVTVVESRTVTKEIFLGVE